MREVLENNWFLAFAGGILIFALITIIIFFLITSAPQNPDGKVELSENKGEITATIMKNNNINDFRLENNGTTINKSKFPDNPKVNSSASIEPIGNGTINVIGVMYNGEEYIINSRNYNYERADAKVELNEQNGSIEATIIRNSNVDEIRIENNKTTKQVKTQFDNFNSGDQGVVETTGVGTVRVVGIMPSGREVILNKTDYNYESPDATVEISLESDNNEISARILRNLNIDDFYIEHNGTTDQITRFPKNPAVGDQANIVPSTLSGTIKVIGITSYGKEFVINEKKYNFEEPNATVEISKNNNITATITNSGTFNDFEIIRDSYLSEKYPYSEHKSPFPENPKTRDSASIVPIGSGNLSVIATDQSGRKVILKKEEYNYQEPDGTVNLIFNEKSVQASVLRNENIDNFRIKLVAKNDQQIRNLEESSAGSYTEFKLNNVFNNTDINQTINKTETYNQNINKDNTLHIKDARINSFKVLYDSNSNGTYDTNLTNNFELESPRSQRIRYLNNSNHNKISDDQRSSLKVKYQITKPKLEKAKIIAVMPDGREIVIESQTPR